MSAHPLLMLADPGLLRQDAWIGGAWVGAPHRFPVRDPATDRVLAEVADLDGNAALAAIEAAQRALPEWRARSAKQRHALLMRWFQLMQLHSEDLACLLTAEQGKPLAEARAEVAYGASFIEWFAEQARRLNGEVLAQADPGKRYLVLNQPVGVCAAITPWNFPIAMITRKVAPALAAGCSVIVKPAEQTPLSALALAELAHRAGMPPGVLNVLTAGREASIVTGRVLCDSEAVRHLSFTGSTEVGRILMQQCSGTLKKLSLELGGNAPFIVFEDADLDSAVEGAMASKFRNAGQTCVCANRLYVQAGVYDAFVDKLVARVRALRVGNGFDSQVTIGPVIDDAAVAKIEQHIADAVAQGAKVRIGGERIESRLFAPTVLTQARPGMLCAREETFGPVAPVFSFDDEKQVLALANDSAAGLAGYVYTRDLSRALRMSERLECGMVGINTGLISTAEAPFGGIKQSGFGREGARQGIEEYVESKYVCIGDVLN